MLYVDAFHPSEQPEGWYALDKNGEGHGPHPSRGAALIQAMELEQPPPSPRWRMRSTLMAVLVVVVFFAACIAAAEELIITTDPPSGGCYTEDELRAMGHPYPLFMRPYPPASVATAPTWEHVRHWRIFSNTYLQWLRMVRCSETEMWPEVAERERMWKDFLAEHFEGLTLQDLEVMLGN